MALFTTEDVKLFLDLTKNDKDEIIGQIVKRVEPLAEKRLGWDPEVHVYTEFHNGDRTDLLILNKVPVRSITDIWDDSERDFLDASKIDSDDYFIDDEDAGFIRLLSGTFGKGKKNIKTVFEAGYDSGHEVLEAIKEACVEWAVILFQATVHGQARAGLTSVSVEGGGSQSIESGGIPKSVAQILDLYHLKNVDEPNE